MKQAIIPAVVLLFAALYLGSTSFSIAPFSMKVQRPAMAIGFILFSIGMLLMCYGMYIDGKKQGFDNAIEVIKDVNQVGREAGKK